MRSTLFTALAFASAAMAADEVHGESALGNTMGPVGFLWPSSRAWSEDTDNTAPCGSSEGVTERTKFPISQGAVSLSIADDAYNVAFYIAVDDDPDAASDFQAQVVQTIPELESGHQCYKLRNIPDVAAGTDATIQLQYWANYDNGDDDVEREKFYSCADITFVDAADFHIDAPCFNVTSEEFGLPTPNSPGSDDKDDGDAEESSSSGGGGGSGLSKGATAGVAVGTIVGSLSVVGLIAWFVFRRRKDRRAIQEERTPKEVEEVSH